MATNNVIPFPARRREVLESTRPDGYYAWKFKRCQREGRAFPEELGSGLSEWRAFKQHHLDGKNADLMREVFAEIERKYADCVGA